MKSSQEDSRQKDERYWSVEMRVVNVERGEYPMKGEQSQLSGLAGTGKLM